MEQGCQTRELLKTTLHVGNRVQGCIMFFDLEITTSTSNGLCNGAHSEVDLQKKKWSLFSLHQNSSATELDF